MLPAGRKKNPTTENNNKMPVMESTDPEEEMAMLQSEKRVKT